ncbi:MAG TPA: phosphate ABC transporter ATP-binding protein PstB [Virgibacillus sp.]|nr:phosphate ABC transporter ATP-binding protein PstB [Virgibacillus sp.]
MSTVKINKPVDVSEISNMFSLKHIQRTNNIIYNVENLNLWYSASHALKGINLPIHDKEVTAIIGPSGCGKSTFLKTLNRLVELVPNVRITGQITFQGKSILDRSISVDELRTRVGMVFQKANPFPKSIYENIAYGPKIHGIRNKKILDEIVETSLRSAYLWDDVKDRLSENAYGLSGGQQQRLCIARCLAIEPDVILMDEPTSALDPKSTLRIEELIGELKQDYSIVIVTHNMQQAARISDRTAFFLNGEVIDYDHTEKIFNQPKDERTADYIAGRFG